MVYAFLTNHCGYIYANDKRHCIITIVNTLNEKIQCNVEIALTDEEHATGLMNRSSIVMIAVCFLFLQTKITELSG
jgi:uncharacterized membrane protein (UPF0127 family)